MKRKQGFTLAEVLITLTIIGVISALTLPAIQSNTAASRNRATLKNTMAILSQAAQNNMATEGWNYSHIVEQCGYDSVTGRNHNSQENYSLCGLLNSNLSGETFLGNLNMGRPSNGEYKLYPEFYGSPGQTIHYQLSNGAIIGIHAGGAGENCSENGSCDGYIDVNGFSGPHREIACSDGSRQHDLDRTNTCEVERTTNADIFPIRIYGNTVELYSNAARSFLNAR